MSMSKEIAAYADVKAILDKVLEARGNLIYKLPTYKKAMHWRYRAYHFRKLIRKQEAARLGMKDLQIATQYDGLQFIAYDINGSLLIKFSEVEGVLSTPDGEAIPVTIDHSTPMQELSDPDRELIEDLRQEILPDEDVI